MHDCCHDHGDTEKQRAEFVRQFVENDGPDWVADYQPGTYGCHELMDRTMQAAMTFAMHVMHHPACVQNAEWYAIADEILCGMEELQTRVAQTHLGPEELEPGPDEPPAALQPKTKRKRK